MILRHLLLFLSNRRKLRRWMETSPAAGRLTSRFIAGLTLEDGLAVCRRLDRDGILTTLDRLGESVTSLEEAQATRDGYIETVERIAALGLPSTISIKLTQFGLDLSGEACRENAGELVRKAHELGKVVEVDMESSGHVDRTLAIVNDLHRCYGNVRAVIQAYLYRSGHDVEELCRAGVPVRLCKGAYHESRSVAFTRKEDVNANYLRLMEFLLVRGVYPALATHDAKIIGSAKRFAKDHGIPSDAFEFQMLYGIRRDLARQLVAEGYRLRLYVPCGNAWYPYFMRRLAERPANLLFLLRNLVRG